MREDRAVDALRPVRIRRGFTEMTPGSVLIENLKNREYCQTVYGGRGEEVIAARFSTVDPKAAALEMESWKKDRRTSWLPRKLERMTDLPSRLATILRAACGGPQSRA